MAIKAYPVSIENTPDIPTENDPACPAPVVPPPPKNKAKSYYFFCTKTLKI